MKSFLAAWQFLTIFPTPWVSPDSITSRDFQKSPFFFPLVGLILGLMCLVLDALLNFLFPQPLVGIFLVVFLLVCTGALHADGLADTADGFFSSRPKEKILEIMRDSRSGPMGVLALIITLSAKVVALSTMPLSLRHPVLLLAPFLGRWLCLLTMNILPYARQDTGGGLAGLFMISRSPNPTPVNPVFWILHTGLIFSLVLLVGLLTGQVPFILFVFPFTLPLLWIISKYCNRKIGGFTGDTLGATIELTELWVILSSFIFIKVEGLWI